MSKYKETQAKRLFTAFCKSPKTMLMASRSTGIERASVCRYVANWIKANRITPVKSGLCQVSNHNAVYYKATGTLHINE